MIRFFCFFLLVQFVAATGADAEVKVSVKTGYYKVSGKDGKTLNANMLREGKKHITLRHAIASTETQIKLGEPKVVVRNGKCVVDDVDVFLKIKYTYPKWSGRNRASRQMRKRWDAFWVALKRHEEKHGEIARQGAKSLQNELMKMRGHVVFKCGDFGAFAGFRLNRIVRKTAAAQRAFDRKEYARTSRISKLRRLLYEAR